MQVEDEKHMSTSLNAKTSRALPSSQTTPSMRGVMIVLCAVAIWSTTPVFIGYLLFTVSLQHLSAPIASIFHPLEPLMTALLALIFLDRMMTVLQWIGLGLIVTSVISMQLGSLVQNRKR